MDRTNLELNEIIERFIRAYDGTAIGRDVQNMYKNGSSYESICEYMGIDYSAYEHN